MSVCSFVSVDVCKRVPKLVLPKCTTTHWKSFIWLHLPQWFTATQRKKEHQRNYNLGIKSSKSKTKLKLFDSRMEKKILMGTSSTRNSLAWLFFQPPLPVVTEIFRRLAFVQKSSLPIIDPIWICKTLLAAKNRVKTLNFELELKKVNRRFFEKAPKQPPRTSLAPPRLIAETRLGEAIEVHGMQRCTVNGSHG